MKINSSKINDDLNQKKKKIKSLTNGMQTGQKSEMVCKQL